MAVLDLQQFCCGQGPRCEQSDTDRLRQVAGGISGVTRGKAHGQESTDRDVIKDGDASSGPAVSWTGRSKFKFQRGGMTMIVVGSDVNKRLCQAAMQTEDGRLRMLPSIENTREKWLDLLAKLPPDAHIAVEVSTSSSL
jgi:hypothetical protein